MSAIITDTFDYDDIVRVLDLDEAFVFHQVKALQSKYWRIVIKTKRRSSILPWMPPCDNYPNIVHRRYLKNGTSATPCTCALKPLIFEFSDSAEAFECLSL